MMKNWLTIYLLVVVALLIVVGIVKGLYAG